MGFSSAGRPEAQEIGPLFDPGVAGSERLHLRLRSIGKAAKSNASRVFPGNQSVCSPYSVRSDPQRQNPPRRVGRDLLFRRRIDRGAVGTRPFVQVEIPLLEGGGHGHRHLGLGQRPRAPGSRPLGLHLLLPGDGDRPPLFGLRAGHARVGLGLVGLQPGADVLARRRCRRCRSTRSRTPCARRAPASSTALEIRVGIFHHDQDGFPTNRSR